MPKNQEIKKEPINKGLDNYYCKIEGALTVEERLHILHQLENKSCETCTNASCNVETGEKVGLDECGKPQGYQCIGWYNAKIVGKSKVLSLKNVYELK